MDHHQATHTWWDINEPTGKERMWKILSTQKRMRIRRDRLETKVRECWWFWQNDPHQGWISDDLGKKRRKEAPFQGWVEVAHIRRALVFEGMPLEIALKAGRLFPEDPEFWRMAQRASLCRTAIRCNTKLWPRITVFKFRFLDII